MTLPVGKLPPDRLARLLQQIAARDSSVLLGPGVGQDCAVMSFAGDQLLVAKSDIDGTGKRGDFYRRYLKGDFNRAARNSSGVI